MDKRQILVVDDDSDFLEAVCEALLRKGYETTPCNRAKEALQKFPGGKFDLIVSDVKMPEMSGIELLQKIREIDSEIPVIVITAFGDIGMAVEAMQKGAYTFIQKKADTVLDELEINAERALRFGSLLNENKMLKREIRQKWAYIGNTPDMEKIRELVKNVADSRSTVLVCGETGTGKELVARAIHYQSNRSNQPFIKVNCAALPEGLIESELFGHEKGAFTGAVKKRAGKFELASGGTLLLDEIGEMPLQMQVKLLRVLQEREIDRVGGDNAVEIDVRIIATTNREVEQLVKEEKFREDLFYRLNVFRIDMPPLRRRMDDIGSLADHFIDKYNQENGFNVEGLEPEALKILKNHSWPGNVRELEHAIERAVVLTRRGKVKSDILSVKGLNSEGKGNFEPGMTVANAEKELIISTLEFCGQNRTKAAMMLDISIRTLRNKINEYNNSDEK